MAELFGRRYTRAEAERMFGRMDQAAGITLCELADGWGRGTRTAEIRTGSGLSLTVALDRAMDVTRADYRGMSLCWRSAMGETHPAYYEPEGLGWLRGFPGGLLTTCGLTACGMPGDDMGEAHGLHGRLSCIPAANVSTRQEWEGENYVLELGGEMREARLFGWCLELRRKLRAFLGARSVTISDEVTNVGARPAPLMLLYHCNLGHPALGPNSRALLPTLHVQPNTAVAEAGKREFARSAPPRRGFSEQVFEHDLAARGNRTCAALVNDDLDFGVYILFRKDQLPVLTQWRMLGEKEYVMGLEPGTNGVTGRANEKRKGRLTMLRPGQTRRFDLEIGVIDGAKDARAMEREVRGIMRGRRTVIGSFA